MSEVMQFDPALRELLLRKTGSPSGEFFPEEIGAEEIPVVAKLVDPSVPVESLKVIARFGHVVTGRMSLDSIVKVRGDKNVVSLKASREGYEPQLAFSVPEIQASPEIIREQFRPEGVTGRGVVIGFADWGFDFAHANFRDRQGRTRLLYLWDQRGGLQPESPDPFCYGREFNRNQLNAALSSPDPYLALGYDPADVDPRGIGTHGTHVVDIAAGNGLAPGSSPGVAPEADLIVVHLRGEDTRLGDTLGDSVRLLEAIRYIVDRAGDLPVCINLSLGRTIGPHDGKTLVEQGLDALLDERPGIVTCLSTGNYFLADIHSNGQIKTGEDADLRWQVTPRNDEIAEMEVWYPGVDSFSVELIDPAGQSLARLPLGDLNVIRDGDRIIASMYHRQHDPNNGDNHIDIFLWPDALVGIWTTRLHGETVVDGRYHAWIERDDPVFQSRFTPECAKPLSTTGTICNGYRTISVGAYDARLPSHPILPFSSAGPSRDGRTEPFISAPGAGIRAARSSQLRNGLREMNSLTVKSGTSMAAPHVTGVCALMFEVAGEQRLSIEQVHDILSRTARSSPPFGETEHLRYGVGRVDAVAALKAVQAMKQTEVIANEVLAEEDRRATEERREMNQGDRNRDTDSDLGGSAIVTDTTVVTPQDEEFDYSPFEAISYDFDYVGRINAFLRRRLAVILPRLLVTFGDSELQRRDQSGQPVYDKRQPLVFGPAGRRYSSSSGQFNFHAANFVYNTAYRLGYEVPVYPLNSPSSKDGQSYYNTAATFAALAGGGRNEERDYFSRFFDIVVWPGQSEVGTIQKGDLLLRGPAIQASYGHIAIIADGMLHDMTDPFFTETDAKTGRGVQCIEAGLAIHTLDDRFGRVLTDARGRVLENRMVLRFKEGILNLSRIADQMDRDEEYRQMLERAYTTSRSDLSLRSMLRELTADLYQSSSRETIAEIGSGLPPIEDNPAAQPQMGIQFVPVNNPQLFLCAPNPVAVTAATRMPVPTSAPDDALRSALQQSGVDNAAVNRFEQSGSFAHLRSIASLFGTPALQELLQRLRYTPQQLIAPPNTYEGNVVQRLGVRSIGDLLAPRLLLAIPGHFRELARLALDIQEAYALENLGWLLLTWVRNNIQLETGISWWIPPDPSFVTAFANPLPPLRPEVQRLVLHAGLIDTTMSYGDYAARFHQWENGLAGRSWRMETTSATPARPFYPQLVNIPALINIHQEQQQVIQIWEQRLRDTDRQFARCTNPSTQALRTCNDGYLAGLDLMQRARMQDLRMVYDFPSRASDRHNVRESVTVLRTIRPVFEQILQTIRELGWNDLLFQTSGAGCFRGTKVPADPHHPQRHHLAARRLSNHSFGIAVDFNAFENKQYMAGTMDPRIVALFEAFHFNWGRCFPVPDPMHFEYTLAVPAPNVDPALLSCNDPNAP